MPNPHAPRAREMETRERVLRECGANWIDKSPHAANWPPDNVEAVLPRVVDLVISLRAALTEAERALDIVGIRRCDDDDPPTWTMDDENGEHGFDTPSEAAQFGLECLNVERRRYESLLAEREQEAGRVQRFVGALFLEWHYENDIDGGWLQDALVNAGVLAPETRDKPCGETCACAEWDDFPQTCYRLTKFGEQCRNAALGAQLATPATREETCPTCHEVEGPYCSNPWHLKLTPEAPDANA